ncbi:MAG: CDP-diacylglycerol--glycerol-3-phosphate 3-phosphatidyltransferase [Pseudomonadota bacterium]|nr:CDP-diacylglycerol--glycerol-3-phosphate 3-phosphatidyltransferase [Gammaproteobacteria bacterium]MBU1926279.1 CDP-diacylglycerol--glycerol-3-phosphate 3-phosphatidyltransferase [Gammaproteobacteria bacterium]MBU2545529.1 CDP-diacylglycerol--glycerol-3-phosphate 3-phosphatidyltransferase [Gammaproteobacteria bacterium]
MKIPMLLTLIRLFLIPFFVLVYYLPFLWSGIGAAVIFAFAGITDWLDGYLARKLGQTTAFGAFLDPVADKLVVAVALVVLVSDPHLPYIALPAAVIIGREIAISALREWMAELGKRASVAVSYVGKVKTTMQIISIIALLACNPFRPGFLMFVGYVSLYIAAILTLWTMIMYLKAAWPDLHFRVD